MHDIKRSKVIDIDMYFTQLSEGKPHRNGSDLDIWVPLEKQNWLKFQNNTENLGN